MSRCSSMRFISRRLSSSSSLSLPAPSPPPPWLAANPGRFHVVSFVRVFQ